jgi:heat-inducible transcriptional repressor
VDDRKLEVLRAIVSDYVATQEPVGSKTLVERHQLGVSSATVRNDMASLEEEGYITQPHTSAGRIPTDKGYRLFVDRLGGVRPLSAAERRAIASFLGSAVDLDDVIARTVRLLAQLTHQVAMVQYPTLSHSTVRHVELVELSGRRLLAVVILSSGRVEQRVIELDEPVSAELLADIRARLNQVAMGRRVRDAMLGVGELAQTFEPGDRDAVQGVVGTVLEALVERGEDRIAVAGAANLSRFGHDFDSQIRPMLQALEEQVVLLHLLGEAENTSTMTVRIGTENSRIELTTASVVATPYGNGTDHLATMGILGPTRMDYPGTIAAVGAVARYVTRILSGD